MVAANRTAARANAVRRTADLRRESYVRRTRVARVGTRITHIKRRPEFWIAFSFFWIDRRERAEAARLLGLRCRRPASRLESREGRLIALHDVRAVTLLGDELDVDLEVPDALRQQLPAVVPDLAPVLLSVQDPGACGRREGTDPRLLPPGSRREARIDHLVGHSAGIADVVAGSERFLARIRGRTEQDEHHPAVREASPRLLVLKKVRVRERHA